MEWRRQMTGRGSGAVGPSLVHALTIDVEGFAESHAESVAVAPSLLQPERGDQEIARNLDVTLELLDECGCRATFFFLGRIAATMPDLVRRVAASGHEVGCHSLRHLRITGQSPDTFRAQLAEAKAGLEDACGQKVLGFRAPDFSIGDDNRWVLDELAACGFQYDSSIVPTDLHDVYGMTDVPERIFRWPNGLAEFPLPVVHALGSSLPIGGGGYFRLYPLALTLFFYRRQACRGTPAVFYIHPYEIGPVAPRLPGLSATQRFRYYVRLHRGQERLRRLLRAVPFGTMSSVLATAGHLPESP